MTFPADAGVELDFAVHPGGGDLRRLALKDADSDAVVSLKWSAAAAEVGFRGYASNRTLARILAKPLDIEGALRGDFRAAVDLHEPRRSTAVGKLEGDGLYALERLGLPVVIDRLRLAAAGDTVRIEESALRVAGERLAVTGTVARKPDTFAIDGRVTADNLDARAARRGAPPAGGFVTPPFRRRPGTCRSMAALPSRSDRSRTGSTSSGRSQRRSRSRRTASSRRSPRRSCAASRCRSPPCSRRGPSR